MGSKFKFETRDERIERMHRDNPGRPIELCTAVVDKMWDERRKLINSEIPERFNFALLSDSGYVADRVISAISAMLAKPEENEKVGVIFCGPAGSGKTYTAYAVINIFKEQNPEMIAFMTTYSQAFSLLKSEFASGAHEEMGSTWDKLNNNSGMYDGVIFVDDVSAQKLTDFEIDKLMMFLEKRFNSYMPFILTTNVKPEDFQQVFGERLASRLMGYCTIVEFDDVDKRLKISELNQETLHE